jgi:predicted transcriptional regulator of viral defense system
MKLPKLFDHFRQGQVFTIEEARDKFQTTGNTLRKRLSELASSGYILPIRQGLYRVCKIGDPHDFKHINPYSIAAKLTSYCYVAFRSALQVHADEIPTQGESIYVVSPTKFNNFAFCGRHYIWCQSSEAYGLKTHLMANGLCEFPLLVTSLEKTIVDCLKRPSHSPSFPEFMRLCKASQTLPQVEHILKYAKDCGTQALYNRLGFLCEYMRDEWGIEASVFQHIEGHMSPKYIEWPIHGWREGAEIFVSIKNRWKVSFPYLRDPLERTFKLP